MNTGLTSESPTAQQQKAFDDRRSELLAVLLVRIAAHLGIAKGEIEILHGGYAPDGWRYREQRQGAILDYLAALADNKAVVPMTFVLPASTLAKFPPAPSSPATSPAPLLAKPETE